MIAKCRVCGHPLHDEMCQVRVVMGNSGIKKAARDESGEDRMALDFTVMGTKACGCTESSSEE